MDEQEEQRLIKSANPRTLIDTAEKAIQRAMKSNNADDAIAHLVWAVEFMAEVVSRLLEDSERTKWIDQIESNAINGDPS